jgi:UDP-GlcNAc:undecaprenyl-phosphate/decaprenyl-phosphate GlcNAc-1-phosphate transferase
MTLAILILAVVGFCLSLPSVWGLIWLGERAGKVDVPDAPGSGGRKDHGRPIVNIGGVGIVVGIVVPMVMVFLGAWFLPSPEEGAGELYKTVGAHLKGMREQTGAGLWLLGSILVLHVMGLVDDRYRLSAWPKLIIQLGVGLALVLGADFRVLEFLDQMGPWGFALSVGVTVVWIVALTNAMNFLDNMDGLSSGVGIICAGIFAGSALLSGQWFVAGLAGLLAGSLLGFLCFNFPPARVYMGDGGSLVVGLLLSLIAIRVTYVPMEEGAKDWGHLYGLFTPLVILAVPIYDFLSVSGIRIRQGKSPMVGDQQHFSHRLVRMGLSRKAAVMVIWACTLATGLSGLMLPRLEPWQAVVAFVQTLAVLGVLGLLEVGSGKGLGKNL